MFNRNEQKKNAQREFSEPKHERAVAYGCRGDGFGKTPVETTEPDWAHRKYYITILLCQMARMRYTAVYGSLFRSSRMEKSAYSHQSNQHHMRSVHQMCTQPDGTYTGIMLY